MRRFILAFALVAGFMFSFQAMNGQAQRKLVLVEIATGTWCTYCPGSAMGADDLLANGHPVAVLEHHDGDSYETMESANRVSYYNVQGFPTTVFDGTEEIVGGNASASIYQAYIPPVEDAYAVTTPFDINMSWTQTGSTVDVAIDVEQVGAYTGSGVNVYLVAIESHIPENWLGMTEVNEVNRDMVPNEMGTALTIMQNQTVTTNLSFTIDPTWVQANMDIVAFVQDPATRVVYNAIKTPLTAPAFQYDQELVNVSNVPTGISCQDTYAPNVTLRNTGSDEITSVTIDYAIDNGNGTFNASHTWTGSLVVGVPVAITLPPISYTPDNNNSFSAQISDALDVNGMSITNDNDTSNNAYAASPIWEYERDGGMYTFNITTDDYGYETYWEISSNGNVLASGGNTAVGPNGGGAQTASSSDPGAYSNNTPYTQQVNLQGADCFEVLVVDDYGDGICCGFGNGSYELLDPYGNSVRAGGTFGNDEMTDWFVNSVVSVEDRLDDEIAVFPNPNNGQFTVKVSDNLLGEGSISVLSMDGRIVFETALTGQEVDVTIKDMAAGTYLVKVNTIDKMAIKKMEIR